MAQVSDEQVNRRIKDPQLRRILKKYFWNAEVAVQGAEAMEKRVEEITEKLREEIRAGFAETAKQETVAKEKTMRELINLIKAQSANVQSESADE